jgi:hypothetical protein
MQDDERGPHSGERVVVRTPDHREFRGILVESDENDALIRFDTGWLTRYPLHLVYRDETSGPRANL